MNGKVMYPVTHAENLVDTLLLTSNMICVCVYIFLIAQLVKKNPPTMQQTLFPFLGWEDPLEKG